MLLTSIQFTIAMEPDFTQIVPDGILERQKLEDEFCTAANEGKLERVKELVAQGASFEIQHSITGCRPLMLAAMNGQGEVCEFLVRAGDNPLFQENEAAHTPLSMLAFMGCFADDQPTTDRCIHACSEIVKFIDKRNLEIKTTLLCLNRIYRDENQDPKTRSIVHELYKYFAKLLLPYLGRFISLKHALSITSNGKRPFDYLKIDILNPDKAYQLLRQSEFQPADVEENMPESEFVCCVMQ